MEASCTLFITEFLASSTQPGTFWAPNQQVFLIKEEVSKWELQFLIRDSEQVL